MKKLLLLTILSLVFSQHIFARNMSVKMSSAVPGTDKSTGIGGSKRFNMLNIKAESTFYLAPGQITVSGERQCGDGDVAHYSDQNPAVDFIPNDQDDFEYVIGYWIVDSSATSKVPTIENWQPVGYNTIAVNDTHQVDASASLVNLVNRKSTSGNEVKTADAVTGVLKFLKAQIQNSVNDGKNYTVYVAGMGCKDFIGSGHDLSNDKVTSYELAHSFTVGIPSMLYSGVAITDEDSLKQSRYFKLEYDENSKLNVAGDLTQKGPIMISFPSNFNANNMPQGGGSNWKKVPEDHKLIGYISDLLAIKHGDLGDSEEDYVTNIKLPTVYTKLNDLKTKIQSNDCAGITEVNSDQRWWDKMPINRSCYQLKGLVSQVEEFFKYHSTESSFDGARANLIQSLYGGAIVDYAQDEAANNLWPKTENQDDLRCFDGSRYVDNIVASVVIPLSEDTSVTPSVLKLNNPNNMAHPEPLYALDDYVEYHADNKHPVFTMSSADQSNVGYSFDLGSSSFPQVGQGNGSVEGSIHLKMRIRSIGCNVNIYCMNNAYQQNGFDLLAR